MPTLQESLSYQHIECARVGINEVYIFFRAGINIVASVIRPKHTSPLPTPPSSTTPPLLDWHISFDEVADPFIYLVNGREYIIDSYDGDGTRKSLEITTKNSFQTCSAPLFPQDQYSIVSMGDNGTNIMQLNLAHDDANEHVLVIVSEKESCELDWGVICNQISNIPHQYSKPTSQIDNDTYICYLGPANSTINIDVKSRTTKYVEVFAAKSEIEPRPYPKPVQSNRRRWPDQKSNPFIPKGN